MNKNFKNKIKWGMVNMLN